MKKLARRFRKLCYYTGNGLRHALPDGPYRRALPKLLEEARNIGGADFQRRLDYYCRLNEAFSVADSATRLDAIPSNRHHTYFYDFRDVARHFPADRLAHYVFGDVIHVPEQPAFVKSRPIGEGNANSVLLRWDQVRHFALVSKDRPFKTKKDMAVWRGRCGSHVERQILVERYHNHPRCDIGDVSKHLRGQVIHRSFMSIPDQLAYKFIISLEGIDVATNLKWIMSSNSLCFMPKPRFETWFMEGTLIPGHHYVLLNEDLSNLEEQIEYYRAHPDEAEAIVAKARAHVAPFRDKHSELLLQLLVMRKYFRLSGQWE